MRRATALVLVLACGFAAGLVWLFELQFASGEAYPDYSTMRTDPAGARVLYDSLAAAGFQVSRNFQPLDHAPLSGATVVLLGVEPRIGSDDAERYEKLAAKGNRVVLGLRSDDDEPRSGPIVLKRWKVRIPSQEQIVERPFGRGVVVIVPDGGVFHNGSLAGKPDTQLILQALGDARRVVFDESHLGMVESGSLVGLARRYRLQGFFWGCVVVAALFLWRSMSRFPPVAAEGGARSIAGRTSASGLAGLLRQNVARDRLVRTAWDLWSKSSSGVPPSRRARAAAMMNAPGDPLATLTAMHRALESKGPNDTRATQNRD